MKRITICAVMTMLLAVSGVAQAAVLTFNFRPNDLLDLYGSDFETGLNATQDNARRVHEIWATKWYQTFSDYLDPCTTQLGSGNTYSNWRDGLGENEGLGSFSTWLHGDPGARSWGEILLADPDKSMSATAASGWNVTIIENEWDTGYGKGYVAVYWTTDPNKYIRPGGPDLGTFSFTADVYVDANQDNNIAGDPHAELGTSYRIWFGDTWMNQGDEDVPALVFDDQGWGEQCPNYGTFAQTAGGDSGFEGILTLSGVPEPATICLLGLGALGLLRKRRA